MPASHVKIACRSLHNSFCTELHAHNIIYGNTWDIKANGTCRRLIIQGNISPKQKDRFEEIIGPPKSVALLSDGSYSKAAIGFAKKQGIDAQELEIFGSRI